MLSANCFSAILSKSLTQATMEGYQILNGTPSLKWNIHLQVCQACQHHNEHMNPECIMQIDTILFFRYCINMHS